MESFLDPLVLASIVTVVGSLAGVVLTRWLSNNTSKIIKRVKKETKTDEVDLRPEYAGYERQIKSLDAENGRVNAENERVNARNIELEKRLSTTQDLADVRERALRAEVDQLYQVLEAKNNDIARLNHLQQYAAYSKKVLENKDDKA